MTGVKKPGDHGEVVAVLVVFINLNLKWFDFDAIPIFFLLLPVTPRT